MMDRVAFAPSKTIEDDRLIPPRGPIPGYPGTTLFYAPSLPLDRSLRSARINLDRMVNGTHFVDDAGHHRRLLYAYVCFRVVIAAACKAWMGAGGRQLPVRYGGGDCGERTLATQRSGSPLPTRCGYVLRGRG